MKTKYIITPGLIFVALITLGILTEDRSTVLTENYIVDDNSVDYEDIKTLRIGFCQSLPDSEATGILYNILMSLQECGLIKGMNNYFYKPFSEDSAGLWQYVCAHVKSDYLLFDEGFFYDLEKTSSDRVIDELNKNRVDLILTYGTKAGTELFNERHSTYVLNFGSNDPVGSGFVESDEYSGRDHLWAHVDDDKYYNQLKAFYRAVNFKKLGVIMYTSSHRNILTPVKDIQKLASENNISYKIYEFKNVDEIFSTDDRKTYYKKLSELYQNIAKECDAYYMVMGGWQYEDLPELLAPFIQNKVPVFSQLGSVEVQNGALMSMGKVDFSDTGRFVADALVKVLAGRLPGELEQRYGEVLGLSVNLKTAEEIGFKFPMELMLNCYEIYE